MSSITIKIPDNITDSNFEIELYLAIKWFEEGKLSSGQAAEMLNISKRTFIEIMGKYGGSVFGYDFDELENDLANV